MEELALANNFRQAQNAVLGLTGLTCLTLSDDNSLLEENNHHASDIIAPQLHFFEVDT